MKAYLLAATMLVAPTLGWAETIDGIYIGIGAGPNWLSGEKAETVDQKNARIAIAPNRTNFSTGARATTSIGYGFANGLRIELEGTVFGNSRTRSRSAGPATPAAALSNGTASAGSLTAGVFVNALYEFDLSSLDLPLAVQPYLGGGVGYVDTYRRDLARVQSATAFSQARGNNGGVGVQLIAGAAFPIDAVPGLALTVEYRATETSGGRYDATLKGKGVSQRVQLREPSGFNNSLLIGVRYAFGQTPPTPPAAPVVAASPAPVPSRSYLVFFDWDRADLTERARQIVAEAAQAAARVSTTRIEVYGNTDRSGTPAYNLGLSRRRAEAVATELVRLGVARDAIGIVASGDTRPLVPTEAGVREPQNRRVEIVLR